MIVYKRRCAKGHTFEGWFKNGTAFADQQERKVISCPVCGRVNNEIAPFPITCIGKGGSSFRPSQKRPEELSLHKACDLFKNDIEHHLEDVGDRFAEMAVKISRGLEKEKNICGTVTQSEEEYLEEQGVFKKFLL
ncbi:MAG: DUF1178 family protein [Syntrophales bacterium]|jgi:hypothetical protein|nr:DUF1178 family protein [Syntrophales bacterium]